MTQSIQFRGTEHDGNIEMDADEGTSPCDRYRRKQRRAMEAMLRMSKLDVAELERAARGA